jgi:hypothetical protein
VRDDVLASRPRPQGSVDGADTEARAGQAAAASALWGVSDRGLVFLLVGAGNALQPATRGCSAGSGATPARAQRAPLDVGPAAQLLKMAPMTIDPRLKTDPTGELEFLNRIWAFQTRLTIHFGVRQILLAKVRAGAKIPNTYRRTRDSCQRILANMGTVSKARKPARNAQQA